MTAVLTSGNMAGKFVLQMAHPIERLPLGLRVCVAQEPQICYGDAFFVPSTCTVLTSDDLLAASFISWSH